MKILYYSFECTRQGLKVETSLFFIHFVKEKVVFLIDP
jgi:hypothetical protein